MSLQWINQHAERALLALVPPLWAKPRIAALLQAFLIEVQALEDVFWDIQERHTLELADLERLRVLGRIVGQPRLGFATEDYRLLIRARALANVSRGRASDIGQVLDLIVGDQDWAILAPGDATLLIIALEPVDAVALAQLELILPDTRAAGVGMGVLSSTEAGAGVLGFYPVSRGTALAGSFLWDSLITPGGGTEMLGLTTT